MNPKLSLWVYPVNLLLVAGVGLTIRGLGALLKTNSEKTND